MLCHLVSPRTRPAPSALSYNLHTTITTRYDTTNIRVQRSARAAYTCAVQKEKSQTGRIGGSRKNSSPVSTCALSTGDGFACSRKTVEIRFSHVSDTEAVLMFVFCRISRKFFFYIIWAFDFSTSFLILSFDTRRKEPSS